MPNNKQCHFCQNGIREIDYKDVEALKPFIDTHGRIINHRKSAICAKHQRKLGTAIKRARFMALMPFIIS
ncbi:MAG: 30S ribosomal protein S18 [Candidatus Vogelbacteria bacterium]|nr:30S ribosomal protein S18 [Candidatus Vogelbacteria bacterium]